MCGVHAKQVDSDEKHFTVDLLRDWKRTAVQAAFDVLTSGNAGVLLIVKLNIEPEVLESLWTIERASGREEANCASPEGGDALTSTGSWLPRNGRAMLSR